MPYYFQPEDGEEDSDKGIGIKHEGMGEKEYLIIRSVLTDGALEAAREASLKAEKEKDAAYQVTLIHAMLLDGCLINAKTKEPIQLTLKNLRKLSPQLRMWIANEINKTDGSIVHLTEVEISGQKVMFR